MKSFCVQHRVPVIIVRNIILAGAILIGSVGGAHAQASVDITTRAMLGSGDRADDAAIWIHPNNESASIVLGVNKSDTINGGLYAFDLDGTSAINDNEWQEGTNLFDKGERYNNVDLRYGFPAGDEQWDIVCASNRTDRELDVFRVNTDSNGNFVGLEEVGEVPLGSGFAEGSDAPYGLGMFHDRRQNTFYVLTSDKEGKVAQYQLQYNPTGTGDERVVGTRVTGVLDVSQDGSEVEGIVADDERGVVYIAAEDKGIYRYATNEAGVLTGARTTVATVASSPALQADVEGLTMYYQPDGAGYLIASVQGRSQYAVYERAYSGNEANRYLKNFSIAGVEKTDGLDVTSVNLGGPFTSGMLVVHDGVGDTITRYKLVSWDQVANSGSPTLDIGPACNPRGECAVEEPEEDNGLSGEFTLRNNGLGGWLSGNADQSVDLSGNDREASQTWELIQQNNGRYRIKNRRFGTWLGAEGEETVSLRTSLGGNESWTLEKRSDNTYLLRNWASAQYLDGDEGAQVGLSRTPKPDDEWVLVRATNQETQTDPATTRKLATSSSAEPVLYPNPARSTVALSPATNPVASLTIYDIQGQAQIHRVFPQQMPIDISSLPDGIYVVSATYTDQTTALSKLVVSK